MEVHKTASLTAVWRKMAKIDEESIKYLDFKDKFWGYLLGILDKNSVKTIGQRTKLINNKIKELNPKKIVEIGAGYSTRSKKFDKIHFYELDFQYFRRKKMIMFDIGKDNLSDLGLQVKDALFIIEGVTMYLDEPDILKLLKQIKEYNGTVLIDFFNKKYSSKNTLKEKIFKYFFKKYIKTKDLFKFKIESIEKGKEILESFGWKVEYYEYNIKTLDVLFYCSL